MSFNQVLAIGVGGFFGAISRYSIGLIVLQFKVLGRHHGTLLANLIGCFIAGCCLFYFSNKLKEDHLLIYFLGIGFLGSLTTFSTFSVELLQFYDGRQWQQLIAHLLTNLILGLILVFAGHRLAKLLLG